MIFKNTAVRFHHFINEAKRTHTSPNKTACKHCSTVLNKGDEAEW
jgi:hypothetical protein